MMKPYIFCISFSPLFVEIVAVVWSVDHNGQLSDVLSIVDILFAVHHLHHSRDTIGTIDWPYPPSSVVLYIFVVFLLVVCFTWMRCECASSHHYHLFWHPVGCFFKKQDDKRKMGRQKG